MADVKNRIPATFVPIFTAFAILAPWTAADATAASAAANYPSRPLRTLVGFPPGSGTDMLARFIGTKLTERVGQQIVVDNRPGANGIIAAELATKAAPDGHTLLYISVSHTMNAAVYKLPFDPVKSFTPVMRLGAGPLVLVANPAFPATTVKSLIELAASRPNTITYAVSGTGGINHFAGAMFARMAGIQLINVPYKGGAQALTEIVGGQVQIMIGTLAITQSQIRAGRLKALGVSSMKRTPLVPDVPTIAESGAPGYEINTWWGILGPSGMPAAIVEKLNAEIGSILRQPESAQRLEREGAEPSPLPSAAFAKLMGSEIEKWRRIARESKIRVE
ncbi:MAG TPA: tripartite tricarboxylate transporter substrate binding protein [Burkholderiales bacterium]|nr:tripartite tricarboxylate transporter substrate binding protein [Burkholderiales bacterium]